MEKKNLLSTEKALTSFKGGIFSGIDSISFSFHTGFRLFFITRVFTDCKKFIHNR